MSNRKLSDFPEGRGKALLAYDFDFLLSRLRGIAHSDYKGLGIQTNAEMILVLAEKIVEMQKKIDDLERTL